MNLNDKTQEKLRIEFAKIALTQLASSVLDSKFQEASAQAQMDADELISVYCWQIADSMIKYMK